MSTIKSSAENLTLNADGANNDIKFQSNGSEVAAIDQAGNLTVSGTVDGVDVAAAGALASAALPKAGGTMTGQLTVNRGANGDIAYFKGTDAGLFIQSASGVSSLVSHDGSSYDAVRLRSGGADANSLTVETSGDVTVGAGDIVFGTAGKGIVLGATTNTDANTLSDYETGTWTVVASGSSSGSGNVGTGIYTKIGRIVHINIIIVSSAFPTFSGSLQMSLPFTGSNQSSREERGADIYFYPLASWTQGSNFNGCVPYVYGANPTVMLFSSKNMSSDRQTPIGNTASGDGGVYARFSMTYTAT